MITLTILTYILTHLFNLTNTRVVAFILELVREIQAKSNADNGKSQYKQNHSKNTELVNVYLPSTKQSETANATCSK